MRILGAIASIPLAVALFFFICVLSPLLGYAAGWAVGLFFDDTIRDVLRAFGVDAHQFTTAQLGATLAFIGGAFFASHPPTKD